MPKPYRPSPAEVATLAAHMIAAHDRDRDEPTLRARISARTLRAISLRSHLRDAFRDEWMDELDRLGWMAFPVGDDFALVRCDAIEGWPVLTSAGIRDLLERVRAGDRSALDGLEDGLERGPIPTDDDGPAQPELDLAGTGGAAAAGAGGGGGRGGGSGI